MSAEARLLTVLCNEKNIAAIISAGVEDKFLTHKDVYQAIKKYYFKYQDVPSVEVVQDLVPDFEPATEGLGDIKYHIDEVVNNYLNDRVENIITKAAESHGSMAPKQLISKLMKSINILAKDGDIVNDIDITDINAAKEDFERRQEKAKEFGGAIGIKSGIKVLDTMYPTGFAGGQNIVIVGWSGRSKSWMATLLACRAWAQGYKPMFVSLEMSPAEVRDRAYTILGSGLFRQSDLARGSINVESFDQWSKDIEGKHPFVVISSQGVSSVTPSIIQMKIDQHRPDIVFVDYLQLMDPDEKDGNETTRMRRVSRALKQMALSNDIPVVALAQATFSDPAETDEPPTIEKVAWSKGIQQDADLALIVHKYDGTDDFSDIIVIGDKNRHGEEFEFMLRWNINEGIIQEVV